ncbi:MAG: hypothetical protein J7480_07855 [Microbacteriaceae bacterium]|nr:hypothetical protein [Microbacteriaceae bacterium]
MRALLRDNGLTLCFLGLFLASITGQSLAGHAAENELRAQHGQSPIGFWDFVWSSRFLVDVAENWQSEFLQFSVFILATVWLVQRGSTESKPVEDAGLESDRRQLVGRFASPDSPSWARAGGWRRAFYSNSLLILMGAIFLLSWLAQSLGGLVVENEDRATHGLPPEGWLDYVAGPEFWNRTLQNWQSEFLAVGAMTAFAIVLRQRGSGESKPVGAPHDETGSSG